MQIFYLSKFVYPCNVQKNNFYNSMTYMLLSRFSVSKMRAVSLQKLHHFTSG